MNNTRQMMLVWRLYAEDFNDVLLASLDMNPNPYNRVRWVNGTLKAPVKYNNSLTLNTPAGDSLRDIVWWSDNTTIAK